MAYNENMNACSSAPCRETQTMEQFSNLRESIENLESRLAQLASRLDPVLRPESPSPCGVLKDTELVPLASQIRDAKYRIDGYAERIASWLDRIEL